MASLNHKAKSPSSPYTPSPAQSSGMKHAGGHTTIRCLATTFIFILFFSNPLFSQKEIISTATTYITNNQYARANRYLDSILKKHPKTVDAIMMKGNVLLNYTWQHSSKNYFNRERAESVFDTAAIGPSFYAPIIPEDTSRLIEKYWRKCLALDSTRNDIRKGLCNLYSISLRIDDLKRQLTQMKGLIIESEDNAFVYAEYARNIKARGKFDEGLGIYQFIANMFPELAGIRCDMAGEYFYNGHPLEALKYLDSTLSKQSIDQTSFINAGTIYSMLGYYDNAYQTFQRYSLQDTLLMGDFYKGVMMFANNDSAFYGQMQAFLKSADERSYADEVSLAQKLIPYARSEFGFDDYLALVSNEKIPAYYRVLIHQRGMKQFKDICAPFLLYGYFQCTIKNYAIASQFLEEVDNCKTQNDQTGFWRMAYAYTLYMSGQKQKAMGNFVTLFGSPDAFRQQASKYFTAKAFMETGKKEEAEKVLNDIIASKEITKYSWLARTVFIK